METLQLIGSTMGIGFLAGIRLYATVLALGLAIRFGLFQPSPAMSQLSLLAHPAVLITAGLAYLMEFVSDKIPWVDSLWDSFHTFIRPLGAALLAATAMGAADPVTRTAAAVLCGGVALTSHSSKASARLAVNHSPEPFTNIVLSLFEDLFVPAGLWLSIRHPLVVLALVLLFLLLFALLAPRIFRHFRISLLAARGLFQSWFGAAVPKLPRKAATPEVLDHLSHFAEALPDGYGEDVAERFPTVQSPRGVLAVASRGVRDLKNSVGYLFPAGTELAFVTRRLFRFRAHRIPLDTVRQARFERGLLLDRLILDTPQGVVRFSLFKSAPR